MALKDANSSVLLENVAHMINDNVSEDLAPLVNSFASIIYGDISEEDIATRSDSDLYGAALSLWGTLNERKPYEQIVKVYNPILSRHGWQPTKTIIEIVHEDMPFLVDSVNMALKRLSITSHLSLHYPISVSRDDKGNVASLASLKNKTEQTEDVTVFLLEVDHLESQEVLDQVKQELVSVLEEVSLSVHDWKPMRAKLKTIISELPQANFPGPQIERDEALSFLQWIFEGNFTLLGYRSYDLNGVAGDVELVADVESSLGMMVNSSESEPKLLSSLTDGARREATSQKLMLLTKSNSICRVHRPTKTDYIGIKRFDENGRVIGEDRFIGLYSSSIYNNSVFQIPYLGDKLTRITDSSNFSPGSHDFKAMQHFLETYPRDELIQASEKELLTTCLSVLKLEERDAVKLIVREDNFGRFFSCVVYVSKERYNTQLREKTQQVLARHFESKEDVEFTTFFSESSLARTHYIVQLSDNKKPEISVKAIENDLIEAARSWEDKLENALIAHHGESTAKALSNKYNKAFSQSYKSDVLPGLAVVDIAKLESLNDDNNLGMIFYRPQEEKKGSKQVRLKLFSLDEPLHLSDVLPMLENFGLRIVGERPYELILEEGHSAWVLDFQMLHTGDNDFNIDEVQDTFQNAFAQVWANELEDDGFNRLLLASGATGRDITVLRAYAKYMRQIGSTFNQTYIEETMARYPEIAKLIIELFTLKFNPNNKFSQKKLDNVQSQIIDRLDLVANLDDDRIIRRYLDMVLATIRTNFYQPSETGSDKSYISFKIRPEEIPEIPLPLPKFEIFVYSPRVEGVHLRGGKVARGGLRWSDRREDFRTEVLGLVKAQQVKNTVIVPVGAKGGFVCKQLPTTGGRDAFFTEGQECYKIFIRALLDITDNIVEGELVPPTAVVRHDEDDPYLVVAADKGTATFSDIANGISDEYNFWMGDAFASGGSVGYDHKKMGITARGGWESVKRHFREIGVDCQNSDFTCIAVGDMAGDVFGNGMLLSKHTCLQAAFNHLHIFIDPTPDSATSWVERDRLFNLPRSSWDDYNRDLISQGGGIFSRSAKSISLTPEIKKMLGVKKASMTPTELIKAILMMKVDLFWNGGIGTYLKGQSETDADVGDRANDSLRINGSEMRAKIIGEGGNLGCTQLGRIEYAANGGRMNTDFIDNVGGVDCSDNEVNIKILLNSLVANGDLTVKQRNELLYSMTDEVGDIVIDNHNRQTQSLSISRHGGVKMLKEQIRFMHGLEKSGSLDRALEYLPSDEELAERQVQGNGFTRPELAVLLAYGKMVLKEQLVIDEITNNSYHSRLLVSAFPKVLQERYAADMENHPLRSEIIATQLANRLVDDMGLNFVHRMTDETGATVDEIAHCYSIASEVFGLETLFNEVDELNNKLSADIQTEMLYQTRRSVRRVTRWFLRNRDVSMSIEETIAFYKPKFDRIDSTMFDFLEDEDAQSIKAEIDDLVAKGVPQHIADMVGKASTMFSAMDIAQVAEESGKDLCLVAETYFKLGAQVELHWFLDQISAQPVANHWQALARASFREELDWQQRILTSTVLKGCTSECTADVIVEKWVNDNEKLLNRWVHMLTDFKATKTHEFAKFSVALRELNLLSHHATLAV
ncbi:NAD-glutamate dehydrogenase [Psychrobium sp. 1_MG-2023]|uniref:NAD-glutamate dehydrogenase n=1 Tax=Psychrobium sp. 1_MG-2023 TaxID=3062624 RepID=UPI000C31DA53|nr:NAD-glutamate dehydrogenase [Psychrobium sp. 1_MG-2023]MDP2560368.1 NAD-glutamate dehydrogenase [Psychrobium sp. 1_MG-2023]PKF55478.1 NAD-glutamate dehydrogenase [Alteromonadales bacterium alter-6D02]